jgi:hypothetical protein
MKVSSRWYPAGVAVLAFFAIGATAHAGRGMSVPVMTALTVKLDQAINAKSAANGAPFTATFKEAVEVGGQPAIPAGASAGGLITKEPGTSAQLELNSVFVGGRMYRITTEPVVINQKGGVPTGATLTFHLTLSLSLAK